MQRGTEFRNFRFRSFEIRSFVVKSFEFSKKSVAKIIFKDFISKLSARMILIKEIELFSKQVLKGLLTNTK